MPDTPTEPAPPAPPRKKPGPKKGQRYGGRTKGTKNRATVEREEAARLEVERQRILEEARAAGAAVEVVEAKASGKKLMKEIAFDFAQLFAGLAAFYQPYHGWHPRVETDESSPNYNKPMRDGRGRVIMDNDNANYDEAKFREYAILAKDTAIAAAGYQSPRMSVQMIAAAVVTKIEIIGGMPDEFSKEPKGVELAAGTVISAEDPIDNDGSPTASAA